MLNRTYSDIKSNVGNNIQDTSSDMATNIGRYINNVYFDVLRRANFPFYRYDHTVSSVSGTQDYILPRDFGKELYVHDQTNQINIPFKSLQQITQDHSGSLDQSGQTYFYSILDKGFNNNPSSSSVITVVSSDSGDSSQDIFIRGVSGNVELVDTINLNGTSSVSGTVSFDRILSISKSDETTGYITITSNSGAVTIAEMSPEELGYRRKFIRLFYTPTSAATIAVPYKIDPLKLYNNYDVPLIPADIIEQGATALAWQKKRQYAKAQEHNRKFEQLIINYIWDNENQINQVNQISVEPASRDLY